MTYKELLNLYKEGKLSCEEKESLEKEIEKQEAISEYLFDNEHIPEFSDFDVEVGTENDDKNMLKLIKKSIRRAFIKVGVATAVIVLALTLITGAVLPHIVDAMYYNPEKATGKAHNMETNKMTLDTTVYTELFTPGYYRTKVNVTREGFGEYSIHIPQNVSKNGQFRDAFGRIERDTLTMFDDRIFRLPIQNAFATDHIKGLIANAGTGAAGSAQAAAQKLDTLNDTDYYLGYVSLDMVMSYDEFVKWSEKTGISPDWCAMCRQQDTKTYIAPGIIGFNYASHSTELIYDNEAYPYLNYYDMVQTVENFPEDFSADVMETHVISMLRYIKDNEDFRKMTGCTVSELDLRMLADGITENGIYIYGFAVVAQKDQLLRISNTENVHYIYTEILR